MKRLIIVFAFLTTANVLTQKRYVEIDSSQVKALQENKKIAFVFQVLHKRSSCLKLEKDVLLQADFPKKNKSNFLYKRKNAMLSSKYIEDLNPY